MKEGQTIRFDKTEQEPKKERECNRLYCMDFSSAPATHIRLTIDGVIEPVCDDHAGMLDALGLAANGSVVDPDKDLADYIRDHIIDVTRRHYEQGK